MQMLMRAIALTTAPLMAAAGLWLAGVNPGAAIERVICRGATPLTETHLYAWLREHLPDRLIMLRPQALQAKIRESFPYVDVRVERVWPQTLMVTVRERQPYATVLADDGRVLVVDASGRPASLRTDQAIALWDRPVIRGCEITVAPHNALHCVRQAVSFLTWLDVNEGTWLDQISEVRVDHDAITLYLRDGRRIAFGAPPYAPKLKALRYAWALAQQRGLDVAGVTLAGKQQVILNLSGDPGDAGTRGNAVPRRRNDEA